MCSLSANLGNIRIIDAHPSSTKHAKISEERMRLEITNGLVPSSKGLENVNDIINDLEQALD